jgi:hypothetical protein
MIPGFGRSEVVIIYPDLLRSIYSTYSPKYLQLQLGANP